MIAAIRRLTTDYVDTEDRLRLSGDIGDAAPVSMWLTQRVALRLLPVLLQWLDSQLSMAKPQDAGASRLAAHDVQKQLVHGFAQEAALAELKPQAPVTATTSAGGLIQTIDLAPGDRGIRVVFRTADGRAAGFSLTAQELRQWLAILRGVWLRADWPDAPWPEWMKGEARPAGRQIVLH